MSLDIVKNENTGGHKLLSKAERKSGNIARIEVDRDLCIGAESCVVVSPDAYFMDEENIAVVKDGALLVTEEELMESAQACPVAAVILYDDENKQIYP
jgi:ferredoxin